MKKQMYYFTGIFMLAILFLCSCKKQPSPAISTPFQDITVLMAKDIHETQPEVIFLDVRTPEETAEGMIENAIQIDLRGDNFKQKVEALNKDKSMVVYCRSGKRSREASEIMSALGFKDIKNMEGGYLAWSELNN